MIRFSFRAPKALCSLIAGMLLLGTSGAAVAVEAIGVLNDTGQATCYDETDHATPCNETSTGDTSPLSGQDGRYGRDAAAAMGRLPKIGGGPGGFDFTRVCMNGDDEGQGACPSSPPVPADLENPKPTDWACLRDNVTGLTFTLGNPLQVAWDAARSTAEGSYIGRANNTSRCGLGSGWRLPHRREALSFFGSDEPFPNPLDPAYFPILGNNTLQSPGFAFWTADPTAWHAMFQWVVLSGNGGAGMQCRELGPPSPCDAYPAGVTEWKSGLLLVNGVWRRPPPPDGKTGKDTEGERWQIRDDGKIVTDTATGLVWDRCGWGQTGPTCEDDITIFPNWADAMQVARLANERHWKGFHDWRLPNRRELESLVKMDAYPAFDAVVFPNTLVADNHASYWTSTQAPWLAGWSPEVATVIFRQGQLGGGDKVPSFPPGMYPYIAAVRLVRGGSEWAAFDQVSERLFWDDFDGAQGRTNSVH